MSGWLIYWITRLDAIQILFIVATMLCGMGVLVSMAFYDLEEWKPGKVWARRFLLIAIIPALGLVFVPSTKEAAAIYLIPKIANNEQVQKVPEQALRLLNAKLEEWIDDQIGTDAEPEAEQP